MPVGTRTRTGLAEITPTASLYLLWKYQRRPRTRRQSLIHNIIRRYTPLLAVILYIIIISYLDIELRESANVRKITFSSCCNSLWTAGSECWLAVVLCPSGSERWLAVMLRPSGSECWLALSCRLQSTSALKSLSAFSRSRRQQNRQLCYYSTTYVTHFQHRFMSWPVKCPF